ncbi:hypothetical protein DFH11DRAFT_1727909 [Phellopilus nigrolimitatus]|nr:hypothetical protein DFH11DRAFT_1727909 [Phellopilus nigrolimitatus]
MSVQYRAAYRSILRELAKSSIAPRNTRSRDIPQSIRVVFEAHRAQPGADDAKLVRDIGNAVTFVRSQKLHKELLDRYNPMHDMTPQERTRATARRVGLDMPIEGKPEEDDK